MLGCTKGKALKGIKEVWVHVTQVSRFAIGAYPEDKWTSHVFVIGGRCSSSSDMPTEGRPYPLTGTTWESYLLEHFYFKETTFMSLRRQL